MSGGQDAVGDCGLTLERVCDRLKGLSTAEEDRRLDVHLAACAACRDEAEGIEALWSDMGRLDSGPVPRERMLARFHGALAAHEESLRGNAVDRLLERAWPQRPAFQVAIAGALLGVGMLLGRGLPSSTHEEIAALRQEIRAVDAALLDHQSASERLRGVELARQVEPDDHTVALLLDTVLHDPSLNVRLAAAEVLAGRLDKPGVRAGLADALAGEHAPLMQVTLARALLDRKAGGSSTAVERLLERDDLDPRVRDYLQSALHDAEDGAQGDVEPGGRAGSRDPQVL